MTRNTPQAGTIGLSPQRRVTALLTAPFVAIVSGWLAWRLETFVIGTDFLWGGLMHGLYQTRWLFALGIGISAGLMAWDFVRGAQSRWLSPVTLAVAATLPWLQLTAALIASR